MSDTTTELKRPVEVGHDVLITPTASARKELPPERYQITRGAVINQVSYHVACHNALLRSAEHAKTGTRMPILNDAERELQNAEKCILELQSLASDEDMDYVLGYLKRVHHWEPRDERPKKMERTPKQVRAAHTLPTVPVSKQRAPLSRGLAALLTHPVAKFRDGSKVTWEQVKKWVHDGEYCESLCNKGTPQETLTLYPVPGFAGHPLLFAYEPSRWEQALTERGLWPRLKGIDDPPPTNTAPPKAEAFVRQVLNPGHGLGKGASTYDAPMPKDRDVTFPIHLQDKKNNFEIKVKLAAEADYFVGALDFSFGRADSKNGGWGMYTPIHRVNGEFKSEVHAITYFVEEAIEQLIDLPREYPKALPADLIDKTLAFLMQQRADGLRRLAEDPFTIGDLFKREEKAAKASTTAPGPGEPARYFHPDTNLPYIHTHELEPWIWVAKDGTCWLFEAPLAPGWKLQDNDHMGPLQVSPAGRDKQAIEAQRRNPMHLGKQPSNGKVKMMVHRIQDREALKRRATNAANVTNKTIGRKLKKKLGHQGGDVLPDGTMVVDPTNAILELHDQANATPLKVEAVVPGKTIEQLLPAPVVDLPIEVRQSATNLTELAKPFGADRRAREVVKKRFTSLYGKLSKMDPKERFAFLMFVNARLR